MNEEARITEKEITTQLVQIINLNQLCIFDT